MADQQTPIPPTIQIIASPQPEDEISLRELWERVLRGKWIILVVTILFLALAGIYLGLTTTVYESKAMVQIGRVADKPIENGPQLASRLKNAYTPLNTEVAAQQLPKLYAVTPDKDDPTILTLIGRAKSPAQAQTYLQGILSKLVTTERANYDQAVQTRQTHLAQLQSQYKLIIKKELQNNQIKGGDATTHTLALLAQANTEGFITRLQDQIATNEKDLSPINTRPTEITLQPTYDPKAVQPKKLVILVLALFGGLIIGIFVVLLRNALTGAPKEE
ncbi:Wzz/FepE/Etk N-terminal domain-containing protein [Acidithiobacillus sp.]